VLPPQDLKTISYTNMKLLVANVVSLIGACESKYALMGDSNDISKETVKPEARLEQLPEETNAESKPSDPITSALDSDNPGIRKGFQKEGETKKTKKRSKRKLKSEQEANLEDIELVKPRKEIEFGDTELLKSLVNRIAKPLSELQEKIDRSVDVVTSSLVSLFEPVDISPPFEMAFLSLD